jgi:hypothetical protein
VLERSVDHAERLIEAAELSEKLRSILQITFRRGCAELENRGAARNQRSLRWLAREHIVVSCCSRSRCTSHLSRTRLWRATAGFLDPMPAAPPAAVDAASAAACRICGLPHALRDGDLGPMDSPAEVQEDAANDTPLTAAPVQS